MAKEDEVRAVLDEATQLITRVQSNPRTWLSWMVYLLARLEEQATQAGSSASREAYLEMLVALQDALKNRARTGGWN